MLIMPLIAFGLASFFQLTGPSRDAAILQAAMPSAVIITVLALEYNLEPALVTEAVVYTTLISPLTLTPLIAFLHT
jgi:predicted permease